MEIKEKGCLRSEYAFILPEYATMKNKSFTKMVVGYDISAYDARRDLVAVRRSLFKNLGVDLVFDVGANDVTFRAWVMEFPLNLLEQGGLAKLASTVDQGIAPFIL